VTVPHDVDHGRDGVAPDGREGCRLHSVKTLAFP
jgi:hypothetical protein